MTDLTSWHRALITAEKGAAASGVHFRLVSFNWEDGWDDGFVAGTIEFGKATIRFFGGGDASRTFQLNVTRDSVSTTHNIHAGPTASSTLSDILTVACMTPRR